MKNKKLVVLLSVLVLATAPTVVAATGCDNTNTPPPGTTQTDEYTFKFVGGTGATGTAPADVKKKAAETFTLPANTFEKEGYTFGGWSDGTATEPYAAGATYTAGTANVTFTAVWTAVSYKVSFSGGKGATGTVADITDKHIGDEVTLPANGFTKTGFDFIGWSIDGKTYAAGAKITIGSSNVSATAVWFEAGEYLDNINASTKIKFVDGTATFTVKGQRYDSSVGGFVDVSYDTGYNYTVSGDVVTFTNPDDAEDVYTGIYKDGVLAVAVPVRISDYAVNSTPFILTKEALAPIDDMGTVNGYSQTYSMGDHIYMYENGVIVATPSETISYIQYYSVKLGTYTKTANHVYSVTYHGDAKSYEMKIELKDGVSFYEMSDGLKGEYSFGAKTITLDGYGAYTDGGSKGVYYAISDGVNTMVVIDGTEPAICEVSGSALTAITAAGAGVYSCPDASTTFKKIFYNGSNLAGFVSEDGEDGNTVTKVISATVDGSKEFKVQLGEWDSVTVKFAHDAFKVTPDYGDAQYYTLGGTVFVEPTPDIADGAYIDNLNSDITASIATESGIMKLTLTKNGSSAVYRLTLGDTENEVKCALEGSSTVKTGYIVNGVFYVSGVKAGTASTTYHVALTSAALTTVSGAEAGYVAKPGSTSYALYLYTNGVAVYRTYYSASSKSSSGKIATYTVEGNEYTLTFPDGTANKTFKVIPDEGETKAYYVESDGLKGSYAVDGGTIVLDGFGSYSKGSETGAYNAGKSGFTIVKNNAVDKVYKITDGAVAEATETEVKNNAGGNANTALKNKGINFKTAEVYTGCGCAVISYTITADSTEGEVQTIKVAVGMTFTVGDENFTVTKVADDSITITRTNTEGVASNAKNLTFGAAG